MHEAGDARERQSRQFGERLIEHGQVARQQRAQDQPGGELAAFAQMLDQRPHFTFGGIGGERHGRLLAGLLGDAARPLLVHPVAGGDEFGERLRQLRHQRLARRRRQVIAREQLLADRRQMPETLHDPVHRERHDLGAGILQQF